MDEHLDLTINSHKEVVCVIFVDFLVDIFCAKSCFFHSKNISMQNDMILKVRRVFEEHIPISYSVCTENPYWFRYYINLTVCILQRVNSHNYLKNSRWEAVFSTNLTPRLMKIRYSESQKTGFPCDILVSSNWGCFSYYLASDLLAATELNASLCVRNYNIKRTISKHNVAIFG